VHVDSTREGRVLVRLAEKSERAAAVDLLIREWGDPLVVRSQPYRIGVCNIFIANDFEGLRLCLAEIGRSLNS
jgi:hypothetical protein